MLEVFCVDVAKVDFDVSNLCDVADVFLNVAEVVFKCCGYCF
jgi:hypothetical protein